MAQVVHKFGGSSLGSAQRYQAVAQIILAHSQVGDAVVVSAAGKTTDTLVKLYQAYTQADEREMREVLQLIQSQQHTLISELLGQPLQDDLLSQLHNDLTQVQAQLENQCLDEAFLLAHGELWSARLLGAYLQHIGARAKAVDARGLFTSQHGQLLHVHNTQACQSQLDADHLHVVTGFIASDHQGNTITFGRNGSDYSATLLGRYLNVQQVCIWTDTQGVFSTDPRKVKSAIKYHKVCRDQAHTLARLGNPVLHAKTLSPLKDTHIKLLVRSSFDSDASATEVVRGGYCKSKSFLTTMQGQDLISVPALHAGDIATLSQKIQHTIVHFEHQDGHFILVPSNDSAAALNYFGEQAQLLESNLNGCAIVAPHNEVAARLEQASEVLKKLNINQRFAHQENDYGLLLTDQVIDADTLSVLHQALIGSHQQVAVIVAGLGNVGSVFLAQFEQQLQRLEQHYQVKLVGLLRTKEMLFNPCGIDVHSYEQQWHNEAQAYDDTTLLAHLNELDYEHKVLIDITASEAFSQLYPEFARAHCHLISANKYAGTAPSHWYNALKETLTERNLQWRYNTSVGAGLPINFALADLQRSGDQITRVQGVFSGTLSWLCSQFDGTAPFSELLFSAQKMGFTEPDPREDLSGRDVQRKLLILARELGLEMDLDDIELSPLMPASLASGSWDDFVARIDELDSFVQSQFETAKAAQKVLRYNADLQVSNGKVIAKVGLVAVDTHTPLAGLSPGDNIFVINSRWYLDNALVIQGPGAGKEVTAAGVHSDLYWLIQNLA